MTSVKPRQHPKTRNVEPFDRMLRRFKKLCDKKGIVKEVRDREHYVKPSVKRNEKNQAIKRKRKLEAKRSQEKGYRRR